MSDKCRAARNISILDGDRAIGGRLELYFSIEISSSSMATGSGICSGHVSIGERPNVILSTLLIVSTICVQEDTRAYLSISTQHHHVRLRSSLSA